MDETGFYPVRPPPEPGRPTRTIRSAGRIQSLIRMSNARVAHPTHRPSRMLEPLPELPLAGPDRASTQPARTGDCARTSPLAWRARRSAEYDWKSILLGA